MTHGTPLHELGLDHRGWLKLCVENAAEDYGEDSLVHRTAVKKLAAHDARGRRHATAAYSAELLRTVR